MPTESEKAAALIERVRDALRGVVDPEAGINIVELGLVYRIELHAQSVEIDLTMTSPTCPMGEMIEDEARQAAAAVLPDGFAVDLRIVWSPPWGPERMSEKARKHFGWDGD
ncbi:MAG TPA: metal-sulfur cluster assembly factor [Azospira sp.]|nr:metal-sulfur cluster assembly factor [Azospira sp.]